VAEGSASLSGRSLPPGKDPVPIVQEAEYCYLHFIIYFSNAQDLIASKSTLSTNCVVPRNESVRISAEHKIAYTTV
jgi:hypothetical protein